MRVGEFDINSDPDCVSGFCAPNVINHAISHVVVHPEYQTGQYHVSIFFSFFSFSENIMKYSILE